MSKDVDKIGEEAASAIIVSTCQLLPKSSSLVSDHMSNPIASTGAEPKVYSILCGSFAEFYIRPLNQCISDIDFLICTNDTLLFNGDLPVLPTDISGLSDRIWCSKIEPCHKYPGFVRLRFIGVMHYNWKYKMYTFYHTFIQNAYTEVPLPADGGTWYSFRKRSDGTPQTIVNGPAVQVKPDDDDSNFSKDGVRSVWCPQWPTEAQDWPLRPRNHGWPTITTICEVVQNGCHVVYVQHRSCRDDERQWRLSFSFAEVILIQSWTQVQQIVYHLLRFFAKRELIQKDCPKRDEVLCTYHLKTLMLWTCEEMPPEWWNSYPVITICCELLKKLSEWLKRGNCPNYFIPQANLFLEQYNRKICEQTESQLNKFCKSRILCEWFVYNYIQLFTRRHMHWKAFNERNVAPHLLEYILHLFKVRKASKSESFDKMLSFRFVCCHVACRHIMKLGLTSGLRQSFNIGCGLKNVDARTIDTMPCFSTVDKVLCFTYYDNVLHILHAAYGLGFGEISSDGRLFVDLVKAISMPGKIIRSQYHIFPKSQTKQSSRVQFLRAHDLLKNLAGLNSCSEFRLLVLMSKESLRRALEYDDSESNGIAPAALAYLAALHFATAEYQLAIRFCQSVLSDHTFQKDEEILNAGCLLFIDDIARIVGFYLLHKKITETNFQCIGRRLYFDLRLSSDVFAYYLCLSSAERIFMSVAVHHNLPDSSFPVDKYLKIVIKSKCAASMKLGSHFSTARQIVYQRTSPLTESKAILVSPLTVKEKLIDMLLEYALEHLSLIEIVLGEDFGIQCNTIDCYRALYFYKCRKYDEAMHLCERILGEPDEQNDFKKYAFANVLLLPPLDSFFDIDVQSLLGFHTLFYYISSLNDEIRKWMLTDESTFIHWFAFEVYSYGMQLSASISKSYAVRFHYFLGRQFVARYLKVRCCINCGLPYAETITDFVAQKTNLPFEGIIRRFILRRLHIRPIKN